MIDKNVVDKYFDKKKTKGRPKYVLNNAGRTEIENLSQVMATDEEIASILGVTVETLQNDENIDSFLECKKKGNCKAKESLRRKQFDVAMAGNTSMLIWLGKQWLGQVDKIEHEDNYEDKLNLVVDRLKEIRKDV